jgi:hypothetical protein
VHIGKTTISSQQLIATAVSAAATAASLALAAWLFDGFEIHFAWFLVAVVLFTALTVVLRGTVQRLVDKFARGYTIAGGLVLTLVVLVLTELVVPESGFRIDGWFTWAFVTVMVWAAGVAYGEVDTQRPTRVRGGSGPTTLD